MVYINKRKQDRMMICRTYVKEIFIYMERTAETKTVHLQGLQPSLTLHQLIMAEQSINPVTANAEKP
jgi:hypothetical protein